MSVFRDDWPIEVRKNTLTGSWRVYKGGRIAFYCRTWDEAMGRAEELRLAEMERRRLIAAERFPDADELDAERFGHAA